MGTSHTKYRKLREESLLEEWFDRDGHWTREFPSRSIIWPLLEHWAAENGYHLVALRANRRLYQLGEAGGSFITYFEIRQDGTRVRIKAWTLASLSARAFRLFLLRSEVPINPRGWIGLRYRRRVCRTLNQFLERCGQPPILHSTNFHVLDLDVTTLLLGSSLLWSGLLLMARASMGVRLPPFPWRLEVVDAILSTVAWPAAGIALVSAVLVGLHDAIAVKRFGQLAVKWGSLAVGLGLVLGATLGTARVIGPRVLVRRVSVECFPKYDDQRCAALVSRLSLEERYAFANRLRTLYSELVRRTE